jgi:hypothetical protein
MFARGFSHPARREFFLPVHGAVDGFYSIPFPVLFQRDPGIPPSLFHPRHGSHGRCGCQRNPQSADGRRCPRFNRCRIYRTRRICWRARRRKCFGAAVLGHGKARSGAVDNETKVLLFPRATQTGRPLRRQAVGVVGVGETIAPPSVVSFLREHARRLLLSRDSGNRRLRFR